MTLPPNIDINWIAVIIAALVNMVVGYLWYSPLLFAKPWSKLTGRKMEDMGSGLTGYIITTVGAFIQAITLLMFVRFAEWFYPAQGKAVLGLFIGALAWVGFVAFPQFVNTIFAGTRKKLWAINTGYFLMVLLINGVLLAVWH